MLSDVLRSVDLPENLQQEIWKMGKLYSLLADGIDPLYLFPVCWFVAVRASVVSFLNDNSWLAIEPPMNRRMLTSVMESQRGAT